MAPTHDEVEWKYDVDDAFALPTVAVLLDDTDAAYDVAEPTTVDLDATYFDTADHRLFRAGLTLRRRTGGSDAGWHLKVPVGPGERREVRAALGRSATTVPLRLRRIVWVHTRDADLVPVLRLQTRRTAHLVARAGSVLAEIADDRVTAQPLLDTDVEARAWRELEVELVEGDRDLLKRVDRGLRGAGLRRSASGSKLARGLDQTPGRPQAARGLAKRARRRLSASSPAGDVVLSYLTVELAGLTGHDVAVRLDLPDSIHAMRVATRRLRSALQTFADVFEAGPIEPVERELKWLAGVLGTARDAEVLRDRLAADVEAERTGQHTAAAVSRASDRAMRQAQRTAFAEVVGALDSDRYRVLVAALDELVAAPPLTARAAKPARKVLTKAVRRSAQKVDRALARAGRLPDGADRDETLHGARKAAKRARYAGEALTPAFGRPAKAFAAAMEDLQDQLGEHHDSVVLQDRLQELAADASPRAAFTYGRLHAAQEARQAEVLGTIGALTKAATKKSLRNWLT